MNTYQNMNNLLDEMRRKRKITVAKFVEGIISERTYRRYINEGNPIQFVVFLQLIQRLGIEIRDFAIYFYNRENKVHDEEIKLMVNLSLMQMSESKIALEKWGNKPFKSIYAKTLLPALVSRYQYATSSIRKTEYLSTLETLSGFPRILEKKFVTGDELEVLLMLYPFTTSEKQHRIFPFLTGIINEEIRFGNVNQNTLLEKVSSLTLQTLLKNELYRNEYPDLLEKLMSDLKHKALTNRLVQTIQSLLENQINYAKTMDNREEYEKAIWDYYTYLFTRDNVKELLASPFAKELDETSLYMELLQSKKYLDEPWIERIGG